MTRMHHIPLKVLALVLAGTLATGYATPASADDNRLDEAWKDAIGEQEPILTEQQFALLNNLAFQAAVTKICDGYQIDGDKFSKSFAEATEPPNPSMTPEDAGHWSTAVAVRFGTTYGLFLAEGNTKPEDFCASAKEFKDQTEIANVWQ
jgi:hypothetical protein